MWISRYASSGNFRGKSSLFHVPPFQPGVQVVVMLLLVRRLFSPWPSSSCSSPSSWLGWLSSSPSGRWAGFSPISLIVPSFCLFHHCCDLIVLSVCVLRIIISVWSKLGWLDLSGARHWGAADGVSQWVGIHQFNTYICLRFGFLLHLLLNFQARPPAGPAPPAPSISSLPW